MPANEKRVAFATLDIGTSQIKLSVYCPYISDTILLVGSLGNSLSYGNAGEVRADYQIIKNLSADLFLKLGTFLQENKADQLSLGLCGHVSSLCEWNKISNTPPANPFPTWLDSTSYDCIDEYKMVMGDGKSKSIIGTFLPVGTNWLFTKLLHRKKAGFKNDSIFLQVADAIFYELTGQYRTHFSSQISMVNLETRQYAPELLKHLQLPKSSLPEISYEHCQVNSDQIKQFGFPAESYVYPAMADLYTSLYGLRLQDKQGFVLANTSEQAGVFYRTKPIAPSNFLSIVFSDGFVNYGSTNTGGNVVGWFLENILRKKVDAGILNQLTLEASAVEPKHTPIILPYLQGERAPLWNSRLTASILELRSSHTDVHLFRAILESIAFARRQCFEELGMTDLALIKIAGGSSKNDLWNMIRATVLGKPLAVAAEKELSMAGIIDYMIEVRQNGFVKPTINFTMVEPDKALTKIYNEKYKRFMQYQRVMKFQADC